MTFLVADCISKAFGPKRVLSSATLRAEAGQVRAILGRNGIGKSTLMKVAAGWIRPDSGAVHVNGRVLMDPTLPQLAHLGVFYLPDHEILSPSFTLGDQLHFFEEVFRRRTVIEAATLARVDSLLSRHPDTLSGGELRRAELAMALTRRPDCLIADEPYRGIAPVDHDALTGIFRAMASDGCAVVVSGHEVPSLLAASDHVTWCTSGTTYELGPPAHAVKSEAFCRDYLGPKYSSA